MHTSKCEYCFWQRTQKSPFVEQHGSLRHSFTHTSVFSCSFLPLWSESNQLWHEKTRSLSVSPLLTPLLRLPPSPTPNSAPSHPPILSPTHIRRAYKHQNAIRPSKTPPVPRLDGPSPSGPALWSSPGHRLSLNPPGLFSFVAAAFVRKKIYIYISVKESSSVSQKNTGDATDGFEQDRAEITSWSCDNQDRGDGLVGVEGCGS